MTTIRVRSSDGTFDVTVPDDIPASDQDQWARLKAKAWASGGPEAVKEQEFFLRDNQQRQAEPPPLMDQIAGATPTALSGAVTQPLSALYGIASIPFRPEEARQIADDLAEAMTIDPETEEGRIGLERLSQSAPIQTLMKALSGAKPFITEGGGDIAEFYLGEGARKYGEAVGDFLPEIAEAAAGMKPAISAARAAGQATVQAGGDLMIAVGQGVANVAGRTLDTTGKMRPSQMILRRRAQDALEAGDVFNEEAAGFRLVDGRLEDHPNAQDALGNGFDPLVVNHLKHANAATKTQGRRMVDLRDRIERGAITPEAGEMRAADIVGQSAKHRYEHLQDTITAARKRKNVAVKDLRGKPIDLREATDNLVGRLDELGVRYGVDANGNFDPLQPLVFKDSVFALNPAAQTKMQAFLSDLATAGRVDAHKAHIYKLGIDDMVGYGRESAEGITGKVETFFKEFRHDLNQSIRQVSPDYADANDVMTDLLDTVKEVDDLIGKKYDPTDRQFGLLSRKTLTNYRDGERVLQVMNDLTEKANKHGGQFDDNLMTLTRLYTDMNRVIRHEAPGGFGGLVQGADLRRGPIDTLVDVGVTEINALRGRDRYSAIQALKNLLDETDG
ncbi:hypothetical protein [uncultured Paraglaciecola sp.]|uniref:hypothetical protein n=1 Tax=uncultured Paraglaciecola sp. TaxID=1765024 RepID=UPI00260E1DE4|nr:hypothetical protein [uncultured Paraglaciecola sp.]